MFMRRSLILLDRYKKTNATHSRTFTLTTVLLKKWKWLSKEEAAKEHEVTIGFRHGNQDDPEYWPPARLYSHSPEMGDEPVGQFLYREELMKAKQSFMDRALHTIFATTFIGYLIYNLYYNHGMLIGHHFIPKPSEFTDEELGIPPDDTPDPEYWGLHGKPSGTTHWW